MSFDYASVAADASELLTEFGRTATLTRNTAGTYNPATGSAAPSTTTQSLTAVMFPYADRHIDGTQIQSGDQRVIASARGVTTIPKAGDTLTWGTEVWRVMDAKHIAPAGTYVLLEMRVRR